MNNIPHKYNINEHTFIKFSLCTLKRLNKTFVIAFKDSEETSIIIFNPVRFSNEQNLGPKNINFSRFLPRWSADMSSVQSRISPDFLKNYKEIKNFMGGKYLSSLTETRCSSSFSSSPSASQTGSCRACRTAWCRIRVDGCWRSNSNNSISGRRRQLRPRAERRTRRRRRRKEETRRRSPISSGETGRCIRCLMWDRLDKIWVWTRHNVHVCRWCLYFYSVLLTFWSFCVSLLFFVVMWEDKVLSYEGLSVCSPPPSFHMSWRSQQLNDAVSSASSSLDDP